jgi:hypothetical protein
VVSDTIYGIASHGLQRQSSDPWIIFDPPFRRAGVAPSQGLPKFSSMRFWAGLATFNIDHNIAIGPQWAFPI